MLLEARDKNFEKMLSITTTKNQVILCTVHLYYMQGGLSWKKWGRVDKIIPLWIYIWFVVSVF